MIAVRYIVKRHIERSMCCGVPVTGRENGHREETTDDCDFAGHVFILPDNGVIVELKDLYVGDLGPWRACHARRSARDSPC